MKIAGRIGREMAVQMLGFGVQIADRILIAGLLIRAWGVSGFAEWSLVLAAGGLVGLFDFGVNLYWANRVLFLVQRGDAARARAVARAGNLLMIGASATGLLAVIIGFGFYAQRTGGVEVSPSLWLAAALVAGATFARSATTIQMSVYRAHEQFARQSLLWLAGDVARLLVTAIFVLAGAPLLMVAAAQCGAAILVHGLTIVLDNNRRFPEFRFGIGAIPPEERPCAAHMMLGFWLQSAPSTALTYIPIFLLGGVSTATGLAQFALMRTLSNVMRAVLQPFSVVCGQESARRFAIGDRAGVGSTYGESVVLLGVLGAIPAAILMALGQIVFALWSGHRSLFDPLMLMFAIAPPLLFPSIMMAQAYLSTINDPWPIAWSRVVQTLLSVAGYVALPIADPAMRMFVALAVAEIVALGIGLTRAVRKSVPGSMLLLTIRAGLATAAAVGMTYFAAYLGGMIEAPPLLRLVTGGLAGGLAGAVAVAAFGIDARRRSALIAMLGRRLRRPDATSPPS
ncbi:hypothetical protein M9980_07565 [Sphingomonas donggukensis]|uniref:Polysaccharide biosynthesis protein n=1 Tax=Sphingomonas donggukensis TaxID=2949093 RepID=A0ABY4TPX8_9SPHN|nr:hypothetical protein [Sphingomonas donggukensis]URW74445.1 hypothetical protein M9980_07565 [Sphingomonas donggukensis]